MQFESPAGSLLKTHYNTSYNDYNNTHTVIMAVLTKSHCSLMQARHNYSRAGFTSISTLPRPPSSNSLKIAFILALRASWPFIVLRELNCGVCRVGEGGGDAIGEGGGDSMRESALRISLA